MMSPTSANTESVTKGNQNDNSGRGSKSCAAKSCGSKSCRFGLQIGLYSTCVICLGVFLWGLFAWLGAKSELGEALKNGVQSDFETLFRRTIKRSDVMVFGLNADSPSGKFKYYKYKIEDGKTSGNKGIEDVEGADADDFRESWEENHGTISSGWSKYKKIKDTKICELTHEEEKFWDSVIKGVSWDYLQGNDHEKMLYFNVGAHKTDANGRDDSNKTLADLGKEPKTMKNLEKEFDEAERLHEKAFNYFLVWLIAAIVGGIALQGAIRMHCQGLSDEESYSDSDADWSDSDIDSGNHNVGNHCVLNQNVGNQGVVNHSVGNHGVRNHSVGNHSVGNHGVGNHTVSNDGVVTTQVGQVGHNAVQPAITQCQPASYQSRAGVVGNQVPAPPGPPADIVMGQAQQGVYRPPALYGAQLQRRREVGTTW